MKQWCCILLCCLLCVVGTAQTHSFEVWTGAEVSADISKRFSIDFEAEARFQQYAAALKQFSGKIGASYSIAKPLSLSVSYECADKARKNGYFPIHTFAGAIGYKKKFNDFRFSAQTKLNIAKNTYTKRESDLMPDFVCKNKLKLAYAGIRRVKPAVFVETYHPLEAGSNFHIATAKYGVNCSLEFRKKIGLDVGYIFRHNIDDRNSVSIVTCGFSRKF